MFSQPHAAVNFFFLAHFNSLEGLFEDKFNSLLDALLDCALEGKLDSALDGKVESNKNGTKLA